MSLGFQAEHRDGYSIVRLQGEPSLGQLLSVLHRIGAPPPSSIPTASRTPARRPRAAPAST